MPAALSPIARESSEKHIDGWLPVSVRGEITARVQTATQLHELLLEVRDTTGAQICCVSSAESGTREEVGRPTTLSTDELEWGGPRSSRVVPTGEHRFRHLVAETAGYSISVEYESVESADNARPEFEKLVRKLEILLSN